MLATGRFFAFATASLFILLVSLLTANAATFTVTKIVDTNDGACDADCSLREAVVDAIDATGPDTIVFSPLFNSPQTINLTAAGSGSNGDIDLLDGITIIGPGARLLLVKGLLPGERVFDLPDTGIVTISGLTISGGTNDEPGGAIQNDGTLTLRSVRITGNVTSDDGGAIETSGNLTIVDSLIDGNSTTGGQDNGGAVINRGGGSTLTIANTTITQNSVGTGGGNADGAAIAVENGTVNLNNVTIVRNSASGMAGGIRQIGGTINIRNTIVALNMAVTSSPDVSGTFTTNGNNLIGSNQGAEVSFLGGKPNANNDRIGTSKALLDPMLGPLQNNSGATDTVAPLAGSPVLENGNSCVVTACGITSPPNPLTSDQRGFPMQIGNAVDIGAVEGLASTAAQAGMSGRIMNALGHGIPYARIVLGTTGAAEQRAALSSSFGYYSFEGLEVGQSYVVTVRAKRYSFAVPSKRGGSS